MGGASSSLPFDGEPYGYRVLDVQRDSPGALAGLVSWFDFIIYAGKTRLVRGCVVDAAAPAAARAATIAHTHDRSCRTRAHTMRRSRP